MRDGDSNDKTRTYLQLASDTVVGHYRIIEKIGAGGMGEVYLAEDTELNRKVALKFLPPHLCQDADCRARFKREAQAAAKLDHPNIVAVHEVGDFQGRPFFSMQHVEGQSLKEVIAGKTLSLERIIEIGIQVCEGLQAAHEKGITHRDIKPSNILIDSYGRARIVDFGLASVMGSDHLTKTGSTLGTIGYMSPEQVRGENVDHRTDLFSFGVVLYEMITGHAPFKTDSEAATLHAITDTRPELLARYRREIPADLQTIIDKALEKDVATRYQHADDMSTDLKRLTSRTQAHQAAKRSGRRVAWSSILIVVVIAGVLVFKPWLIVIKPADEAKAATKRVVVVPFKNQTGDPSLDPLGKMVADWTTQSLMQTGLAEVVPPEVVSTFDANKGFKSVVEATGAAMIVTGSYYKIGDSIQFQALVSDADEKLLQAVEPIYAPVAKVMVGVESVRQRVLGALAVVLDERFAGTNAQTARPPSFEAYQEFMEGADDHRARNDYAAAKEHYKQAYALDTTFLQAVFGACSAAINLSQYDEVDSLIQFLDVRRARLTVLQQLALDNLSALISGDREKALSIARKATKLAPGSSFEYNLGWQAVYANHPREAIEAFKRMDPDRGWARDWVHYWTFFAAAYHTTGDYDEELKVTRKGRDRFPTNAALLYSEIGALAALGKTDEIRKLISTSDAMIRRSGDRLGDVMSGTAQELQAHGREDEATALFDSAVQWYEAQSPETLDSLLFGYGAVLYDARRWDQAENVFLRLAKRVPKDSLAGWQYESWLGWIAARKGDRARAMEVSEWLKNLKFPHLHGENTYHRACIAAILGDKAQAVALLKEAFIEGLPFSLRGHNDNDLESLWDYPPYIELMKPKG